MERHRLLGLDAGRFVAALLVACFHFTLAFRDLRGESIFQSAFRGGHAGVEYFFVLSGFIIFYIHGRDIGPPHKLRPFVLKRLIRLYPMFWAVLLAMLTAFVAVPSLNGKRDVNFPDLLLDALLLPTNGDQIVLQSWSLRHEVVFYAFFAIAILRPRLGLLIIALWQISSLLIGLYYPDTLPTAWKPFFYLYNVGFGVGMAAAWGVSRWHVRYPALLALAGALLFICSMIAEWELGKNVPMLQLALGPILSPFLYIAASTMMIYGLTQVEIKRPLPRQGLLMLLGGSSYLLYLVRTAVGSVIIRAFGYSILVHVPSAIVFATMIAGSVAAAIFGHLLIEKPLLVSIRRRVLPYRRVQPAVV